MMKLKIHSSFSIIMHTMFVEGRAAEVEVLKGRLQFDMNCRTEEIDVKKRKLEQEKRLFEWEERWRNDEHKEKGKDRKANFVMQMSKEGWTADKIRELWKLMEDFTHPFRCLQPYLQMFHPSLQFDFYYC